MSVLTRSVVVRAPYRRGFADLTNVLRSIVRSVAPRDGLVVAFCAHTTCSLVINEWEDGAHTDLRRALDSLVPTDRYYCHDDLSYRTQNLQPDEPANGHAHVAQMLTGSSSQLIPILDGDVVLGRWQRLMLLELDDPRDRKVFITVMAEDLAVSLAGLRGAEAPSG